jgi:hypothetical protein
MEQFYNVSDPGSFGGALASVNLLNALHFGCKSNNCTATELSHLQWGSSGVTNNPLDSQNENNEKYMPKGHSMAKWGANTEWPIQGVNRAPEYFYYTAAGFYTFDDFGQFG